MRKPVTVTAALVLSMACGIVLAQDVSGTVAETIAARRGLMNQLASIQTLTDTRAAEAEYSPELYDLGQAAAASLEAFALLLPENTNLLGGAPAPDGAETTAAPAIWEDLPGFQQLLRDAATHARTAAEAADVAGFRAEWDEVVASCSSCHERYVDFDPFAGFN